MFHHILVGIEDIEHSKPAIETGLELARRDGALVEFVHAVQVPTPLWPKSDPERLGVVNATMMTHAWETLSGPLAALLADGAAPRRSVEDVLRVLPGPPPKVLLDRAEECKADLILLGPHHKHGLFDFGSTARAVLAHADCAVMVQPGHFRPIRAILVPVDLSAESLQALERARTLARDQGATIRTLHCFSAPEFAYAPGLAHPVAEPTYVLDQARDATREEYERVMADFDWQGVDHQHLFVEGVPAQAILDRQEGVDLIMMGTHGRTGLSAAVLGSVAYAVMKHSDVPVMAIRLAERKWLT